MIGIIVRQISLLVALIGLLLMTLMPSLSNRKGEAKVSMLELSVTIEVPLLGKREGGVKVSTAEFSLTCFFF